MLREQALRIRNLLSRDWRITLHLPVAFLFWFTLFVYVPSLPVYVQTRTSTLTVVGLVLSMFGMWQLISRLPIGIIVGRLGRRKPFILLGCLFAVLGAWLLATAFSLPQLLVGRAVTGIAGGMWVVLVVSFNSLVPPQQAVRATALLTAFASMGRLMATGSNGFLITWGGEVLPFYVAIAVAIAAGLLMAVIPETPQPRQSFPLARLKALFTRRDILLPSLVSICAQFMEWGIGLSFSVIIAAALGADEITQAGLVTLYVLLFTVGNFVASGLSHHFQSRHLVYASFALFLIGIGGMALAFNLPMLILTQFCIGLAQGIGYPVLMGLSIRHVAEADRPIAMGLHQSVYSLGIFVGPWVCGWLADLIGMQAMFVVIATVFIGLGVLGARHLQD